MDQNHHVVVWQKSTLERRLSISFSFLTKKRKTMPLLAISFGSLLFIHCGNRGKEGTAFKQSFPVPSAFPVLECSLYGRAYTFWGVNCLHPLGSRLVTPFGESTGIWSWLPKVWSTDVFGCMFLHPLGHYYCLPKKGHLLCYNFFKSRLNTSFEKPTGMLSWLPERCFYSPRTY